MDRSVVSECLQNTSICSVRCEQKAAEERENAASAAKEQAEEARAAKVQVEVARASEKVAKPKKVLTSTKTTAVKVTQYPIGDGSSLAKSVRFCPTEEIETLGRALDNKNMTIHDLIFLISRSDDECNRSGKRKHRHQLKCVKLICGFRLKELEGVLATGLTTKRKQLKSTVDREQFSSTVTHITLAVDYLVRNHVAEVKKYLDDTLSDFFPVSHWKILRTVGLSHNRWAKTLKQIATDHQSQLPSTPPLNAPSVHDIQALEKSTKSTRIPDGDDGDDGDDDDDSDNDDDDSDDDKSPGKGSQVLPHLSTTTLTQTYLMTPMEIRISVQTASHRLKEMKMPVTAILTSKMKVRQEACRRQGIC